MPSTICEGCGKAYKRSGILPHLRKSKNPRCQAYHALLNDGQDLSTDSDKGADHEQELESDSATETDDARGSSPSVPMFGPAILDAHASEPVHDFSMHIDVAGDFYNDYEDYTMGDFELDDDGDGEEMVETSGEGGTDSDRDGDGDVEEEIKEIDIDVMAAEAEAGLEPERAGSEQPGATDLEDGHTHTAANDEPALRLHGGEEEPLKNRPFVIQFPGISAGAVHSQRNIDQNSQYSAAVGGRINQFAPFSSQMEWEIARWAQLRGPSSTAFNELMAIEEVSGLSSKDKKGSPSLIPHGLSFKNSGELNKLIDKSLPGRPAFKRHEVMVGSEVSEVYFRDVVAYIKSL
ncbi:uncharacterized protein LACBIDRAFT_329698 [Laccaria bicolor S238N-H82]|uniref:Predicted protein n=1 Tax=Laccaria bicolor (strain S238N-H82 / ATCC MYA-4686) TaxID=486041 RepID=B0DIW8_LACBS|nr:uncharacterized protein LACBIDRAFT_329698 [Laccaria bicolor S238N-H82]EDR05304.1 predicted protein [Laccaria bicolor S238N-H82]|eukprot:XP_001883862.1 predicted protein [Laccaria bicolor S238N-H82]